MAARKGLAGHSKPWPKHGCSLGELWGPDRVRLLAGCSLKDAFRKFVLDGQEVLVRDALKAAPEFESVFRQGRCTIHGIAEWPVISDDLLMIGYVHPNSEKQSVFAQIRAPDPIEVAKAAEGLLRRHAALMRTFREGELETFGVAQSTGLIELIPRSIWAHDDFYFSVQGDVFQRSEGADHPFGLVRRWAALELRAPNGKKMASTFHVEPTTFHEERSCNTDYDVRALAFDKSSRRKAPKRNAVAAALAAEGIGERGGRTLKEIVKTIRLRLPGTSNGDEALAKTIARLLPM